MLSMDELEQSFLKPVLALENEVCYELLAPFVSMYVCVAIYDAPIMPANAIDVLRRCLDRLLADRAFSPKSYRDGEITAIGYQGWSRHSYSFRLKMQHVRRALRTGFGLISTR